MLEGLAEIRSRGCEKSVRGEVGSAEAAGELWTQAFGSLPCITSTRAGLFITSVFLMQ